MSATHDPSAELSVREARRIVGDLFKPNPLIYWADFLGSLVVGMACFAAVRRVPWWWLSGILFFVAGLCFYRAALFTHELTHLREGTFRTFRVVWNLLCGIPFLIPSFTYYIHLDHHRRRYYGTDHDGEYLALAGGPPRKIVWYLAQSLFIPALAVVRFMILSPIGWVSPSLRRWIARRASSMVMDPGYVRPLPSERVVRIWRMQEAACFLYCVVVAVLWSSGVIPRGFLPHAYLTGVFIVLLNEIRTMAAHRFVGDGGEMSFTEQLVDSLNFPRWPLVTGLWAPVGLRYHALHHLLPSLPYHSLDKAHRRLMAELPADSPYRRTVADGLCGVVAELWRNARRSRRRAAPQPAFGPPVSAERSSAGRSSAEGSRYAGSQS